MGFLIRGQGWIGLGRVGLRQEIVAVPHGLYK